MLDVPAILRAPLSAGNFHLMGVPYTILGPRVQALRADILLIKFNDNYSAANLPQGLTLTLKAAAIMLKDLEDRGIVRALRPYHAAHVTQIEDSLILLKEILHEVQELLTFHVHSIVNLKKKLNDPHDNSYNRQPNSLTHSASIEASEDALNMLVDIRYYATETIGTVNLLVFGEPLLLWDDNEVQLELDEDSGFESDEEDDDGVHNASFVVIEGPADDGAQGVEEPYVDDALGVVEPAVDGALGVVDQPLILPLPQFNFQVLLFSQIDHLCILPRPLYVN